jgi:ABC-type spermidine/putrescine transport system permease subunit II
MRETFNEHAVLKWTGGIIVAALIIYIFIPPVMALMMSFNDSSFVRFPIKDTSLRWYGEFLARDEWVRATINSLQIATFVSAISTVVGVVGAYAYVYAPLRRRDSYYLSITLPLYVPGAVLGLGISIMFGGISLFGYSLYGAKLLVVAAHCMWAMPLAFMICVAALRNVDISIVEAAADLGASPLRSFFTVTLPLIETGIISSAILSFVISLNEFPMALFLTNGDTRTLPVMMWMSMRSAATPVLAVASVILLSAIVAGLGTITWFLKHRQRKAAREMDHSLCERDYGLRPQ